MDLRSTTCLAPIIPRAREVSRCSSTNSQQRDACSSSHALRVSLSEEEAPAPRIRNACDSKSHVELFSRHCLTRTAIRRSSDCFLAAPGFSAHFFTPQPLTMSHKIASCTPTMGSGRIFPIPEERITCERRDIPAHWARLGGLDFGWDHPFALYSEEQKKAIAETYLPHEREARLRGSESCFSHT